MVPRASHRFTRRGFLAGSAVVAASAATTLTLDGCSSSSGSAAILEGVQAQFPDASVEYLSVDPEQVIAHTTMNNWDSNEFLQETKSFDLPLGSLVYQSSNDQALVLAPGASTRVLTRICLADLNTGEYVPILGQALGTNEDFVIYEARASGEAIAWVECNMVHGQWRVYATPQIEGGATEESMLQAQLLEEGTGDYSPPQLAVSGKKVYWTVMPDPNGPAYTEDSYLRTIEYSAARIGETAEVNTIYTSHGRMITNPIVSGDTLTFVPRVDTDAVYYQLTTLDLKTDAVRNISILPPSVRVSDAVWLGEGFTFGIEANYDYALGLSLFGTYQQLGDGQYLYVNKAPVSTIVQMGSLSYVKSTKNVLGINASEGSVIIVDTPQDCVSYGDILGGAGKQDRLVLYTTVTSKIGQETGICRVRVLDAL